MKRLPVYAAVAIMALCLTSVAFGQSAKVVKAEGVISTSGVKAGDSFKIAVVLTVEEGYHINAHIPSLDVLIPTDVKFEPAAGITLEAPKYPAPNLRSFEFEPSQKLAVYEGTVVIVSDAKADASLRPGSARIVASVQVQSCNDQACLQPSTLNVEIPINIAAQGSAVTPTNEAVFARASAAQDASTSLVQYGGASAEGNSFADLIKGKNIAAVLFFVFLAGLALNTTPCVYPIIPITIGFFANQSEGRLRRTFLMASAYVIGMAVTYSILGVVASLTKGLFGAALQNPIVLIGLAVVMVGLSLSMFGVYEFRLPESLNQFANKSTQSSGGIAGALVMGLTMGIVAAPCIGPFVLGLLVVVGEKGDPVYGFFMFFVLALGLGFPYLILGTFSGALKSLPRSGLWMVTVRKVFGLVLIGMAIYFVNPLLGRAATIVHVVFFAASALYLLFFEAGKTKPVQFAWVLRALGVGAAVIAVVLALPEKTEAGMTWQPFSEEALMAAAKEGKPVIVDSFADWCIPCKELDKLTFTNRNILAEANNFVRLKLDLTHSDEGTEAARARDRYNIKGVPTLLFFDASGHEIPSLRLAGFEKPDLFLGRMKKASSPAAGAPDKEVGAEAAKSLPASPLALLNGATLDLSSSRGKVVLVDFWATWCVPCASEIPTFNSLYKTYKDQGLEIVAVAIDEEGATKVKPFIKQNPMSYTVALGDKRTAESYGVTESLLPVAVIADKQGRIRFRHTGVTPKSVFESEITSLLKE